MLPKLSEEARAAWDAFADNANWTSLHPLDWQRFYDFVIVVHRRRESVSRDKVVELLKARGIPAEEWQLLQAHYWTALEVLERYEETFPSS